MRAVGLWAVGGSAVTYSVGVDMGGTFTDGYFSDGERAVVAKVPTTHFDLTRSVTACLAEGAAAFDTTLEEFLSAVALFRLATTIGTNAVVTGTGDPVGLIVEAGAEKSLYGPSDPAPAIGVFVRADHVVGIDPAAAAEDVLGLCRGFVQQGVRQTVLSLRGDHREAELGLRELVRDRYPVHYLRSMPLTLGWETAEVAEDDLRTSTAVLNAYLSRPMAKLLYRTEGVLQQAGLSVPLLAARSDGACSRMPRTTAISTYSSGPAAGLGLVAAEASRRGDGVVVGFDMGGTTLDLGLVRDGSYEVDDAPEVRGVRVSLPVPGIVSVGLGGSSIASLSDSGTLTVGPASAGAVPGPAAFDRGGTEPTLTDADVVLGLLADGHVLPGDIVLDAGRAAGVLAPLADGDPVTGARLVHVAAHSKAASAVGRLLAEAGVDPAEATLYAFGGAGGLHAGAVAELAGIGRIRSFAAGGVFSARGVAEAAVQQCYRSAVESNGDPGEVVSELVARARLDLAAERLSVAQARITVTARLQSGRQRSADARIDADPAAVAIDLLDGSDPIASIDVVSNWQPFAPYGVRDAASSPGGGLPGPNWQPFAPYGVRDAASSPGGGGRDADWQPFAPYGVRDAASSPGGGLPGADWQPFAPGGVQDAASSEFGEGDRVAGPVLVEWFGAVFAVPSGWTVQRQDADSLLWERSR